jgi:hypothetical protein
MRIGIHIDRVSWMKDFGTRAVAQRIQQLRDGGERSKAMWKAGGIGAIPFVKYLGYFRDSTRTFNRFAIDTLGMGDSERAAELYAKAEAAADYDKRGLLVKLLPGAAEWVGRHAFEEWCKTSALAAHLQEELAAYLAEEIGQDLAADLMGEMVHLKPVLGQAVSGCKAMWKCDQKMKKALVWIESAALDFHLRTFAVNALAEIL